MKLVGENFSRNGHNVFRRTIKALDDDGNPMGWADVVNLYNRRERMVLVNNLTEDLIIAVDDARRMVNQLHQQLEREARAGERLPDEDDCKRSQASMLVELAGDIELWHTSDGSAYATIEIDGHQETWAIRTKGFREWLAYRFFQQEGNSPGGQAVADALAVLGGKALFEGPEHMVYTRVAEVEDRLYLDLANDAWEVIEVTTQGWRVTNTTSVKFRRPRGMLSLPTPLPGGDLGKLRGFLHLASDDDWALFLGCLVQAMRGRGPYPILVFHGEQGSTKSTAAKVYRRIIDPNKSDLRSPPRNEGDQRIQAINGLVLGYDNITMLPEWLSNALCRLSTGGGMGTRELYSDDEEIIFDGERPIVLNGIEEVSSRPDLLDRSVILLLKPISQRARRPERTFWHAFDSALPSILEGLLDAVVVGLQREPETHIDTLPRMADFALWATACEAGLGRPPGAFMQAYMVNRDEANSTAIEGSIIGQYIVELIMSIESGQWTGNATELLPRLVAIAPDSIIKQDLWPKRANGLSGKLRALAPNLRAAGFDVYQGRINGRSKISLGLRKDP